MAGSGQTVALPFLNYIQISISFDSDKVNESEVELIAKALDSALADADALEFKYSFNPCTY